MYSKYTYSVTTQHCAQTANASTQIHETANSLLIVEAKCEQRIKSYFFPFLFSSWYFFYFLTSLDISGSNQDRTVTKRSCWFWLACRAGTANHARLHEPLNHSFTKVLTSPWAKTKLVSFFFFPLVDIFSDILHLRIEAGTVTVWIYGVSHPVLVGVSGTMLCLEVQPFITVIMCRRGENWEKICS